MRKKASFMPGLFRKGPFLTVSSYISLAVLTEKHEFEDFLSQLVSLCYLMFCFSLEDYEIQLKTRGI